MCIKQRDIVNPAKRWSRLFSDRLILSTPCGKCCECQQVKANEWYYRAMAEWKECIANGGYVLMDCLTYAPKYLPVFSDFLDDDEKEVFPAELDFPCFSHRDIRLFRESLHIRLKRAGFAINKDNFRFFLASEYGTAEEYVDFRGRHRRGTHRPHYHLLFFVTCPNLSNLRLSAEISDVWFRGSTDGVMYKGARYVNDEKTFHSTLSASNQVARYVTKYVQKDCEFRSEIDKRINKLVSYYAEQRCCYGTRYSDPEYYVEGVDYGYRIRKEDSDFDYVAVYLATEDGKKKRADIVRLVDQFHRQSTNFGACAMKYFDMENVMENGVLTVSDSEKVVLTISLPLYYKRKLFYSLVTIDGVKTWQPSELGIQYIEKRREKCVEMVAGRYYAAAMQSGKHTDIDFKELAYYVVYRRGTYRGDIDRPSYPLERLSNVWYSYSTSADISRFGHRFVTSTNLGNNMIGYRRCNYSHVPPLVFAGRKHRLRGAIFDYVPLHRFIIEHVFFDERFESVLSDLQSVMYEFGGSKQSRYELDQRNKKFYDNWNPFKNH